jgi:heme oxygenase
MNLDKRRRKIRVALRYARERESVCKSTDFWYFWYSSMRAVCKHFPDRRTLQEKSRAHAYPNT